MEEPLRDLLVEGACQLGLSLSAEALDRFGVYNSLLQRWGRKINLSTRLEAREIVVHHFLDSLSGASFLAPSSEARVVDLGSGAGLPGFPLKFALPGLRLVLVESVRKKISFCQEVIRSCGVLGVEALWGRGEVVGTLPAHRGAYDWAVSRALGQAADIVELALPFLRPRGKVLLYKGAPAQEELAPLQRLCAKAGARMSLHPVAVPHLDARRTLILVES